MVCAGIDPIVDAGIEGIMRFPITCDYYFYAKIMAGIFIILTFILYYRDREKLVKPDVISCMGISAMATIFISLIGSLLGIITSDVLIEIVVGGMIFIIIWLIKR